MPSLALNVLSLFRSKSALPDDIYTRNSPARSSRDLLTSDLEHDIYARDAHVIGADQYVWDAHFDSDWDECDAGPQLFQAEKFRDYEKVYHVIIKEHRGLENEEEDNLVQYNLETLDSLHEVAVRERDSAKRYVGLRFFVCHDARGLLDPTEGVLWATLSCRVCSCYSDEAIDPILKSQILHPA
jgi:hypothetical protein